MTGSARRGASFVLALPAALIVAATARAEEESVEPIITEETLPNEPGELDVRVSTEYRTAGGEIDLPFVYRAGDSREHGVGDLSASLKWLLLAPEGTRPAVALGLELGCPTGDPDRETGEGAFELGPSVALLTAARRLTLQGDVAWSAPISGASGESTGSLIANLSAALPLLDQRLHLMSELSGEVTAGAPAGVVLSPGAKCRLSREAFVALAWPIGVTRGAEGFGMVFQLRAGTSLW